MSAPVLELQNVTRTFSGRRGLFGRGPEIAAVDDVSLSLEAGTCLGLVGESGCGKTTLGRVALGLTRPSGGRVVALGHDLSEMTPAALRRLRAKMASVHQNPLGALDPRMPIGAQVEEPLKIHHGRSLSAKERRRRCEDAMRSAALDPELTHRRPQELSGGQRQRVVLARALVTRPSLIVFDEPTSALDVSVQAEILALLQELKETTGAGFLFISHDLRVVRQVADRLAVMYRGRVVEEGPVDGVLDHPLHPYTKALRAAVPEMRAERRAPDALASTPSGEGESTAGGCAYRPRCADAREFCASTVPSLTPTGEGRRTACLVVEKVAA